MKNLIIPAFFIALLLSFTSCNLEDIFVSHHTIHVVADANAIVTPSTDQKVKHNSDLSISITPKAGCNIDSVLVDGVNIGVLKSYIFKNITTDHSITVKASTKVFYTVAAVYDTAKGTVSPKDTTVEKGKSATFKITPDPGYLIESLKDDGNVLPPIDIYTVRNISENDTFEVSFKKDSIMYPLLSYTWYQDSLTILINGVWEDWSGNPLKMTVNFNSDWTTIISYGGNIYSDYKWSLDKISNPITINFGGSSTKLEFISEQKMIISEFNPQGYLCRYTYINKGNKIVLQ